MPEKRRVCGILPGFPTVQKADKCAVIIRDFWGNYSVCTYVIIDLTSLNDTLMHSGKIIMFSFVHFNSKFGHMIISLGIKHVVLYKHTVYI